MTCRSSYHTENNIASTHAPGCYCLSRSETHVIGMQPDPDSSSDEDQTDPQRTDRLEFTITPRILGGRRSPGDLPRSQGDKILRRRKTSSARQLGPSLISDDRLE
jgi:hypothetical protein